MCRIAIFFVIIINSYLLQARVEFDSCNCEAKRILDTYKRLESKYREIATKKVLYYISEDDKLKNYFLNNDSSNLKNLVLYIYPILKISESASHFSFDENICKYFVFDTINYECIAEFYYNDSLMLFLTRGHNDCDESIVVCGGTPPEWCPGEDTFKQYIYETTYIKECQIPNIWISNKYPFIFYVDGINIKFIIQNNIISIYPEICYNDHTILDKPNIFLQKEISENRIREIAKYQCHKKRWWEFWK